MTTVLPEVEEPIVTPVDRIEQEAAFVLAELGSLTEHARGLMRSIQDVEARIVADEETAGGEQALRHKLLHDLRVVRRKLQRAQLVLVAPTDERATAAAQQLRWLDEAENEDRPWRGGVTV